MQLTPYLEKEYSGKFNLKALEKKLVIRALGRTKDVGKLSRLLRIPELDVLVAIIRHRIAVA